MYFRKWRPGVTSVQHLDSMLPAPPAKLPKSQAAALLKARLSQKGPGVLKENSIVTQQLDLTDAASKKK
jgi:hypothetical protein